MPPPVTKLTLADLKKLAEKIQRPPEVAFQLNRLLQKPTTNAQEIAELIKMDTQMTAQVLRMCNSAAYGLSREITTVKEAVAMLGSKAIVGIVFAILGKSTMDKDVAGYGLGSGQLFRNALTGAVYARAIAGKLKLAEQAEPEEAFTGAILRDIGKLLLEQAVGESYQKIETYAMEGQIPFPQAEKDIIGLNHLEAGHYLGKLWGLPDVLIKCIRYKTQPSALPESDPFKKQHFPIVAAVHLGDTFARLNGVGMGVDGLMYTVDEEALRFLPQARDEEGMELLLAELLSLHPQVDDMMNALAGGGGNG
jgi:HD-like signal output (HDOD) protein